MTALESDPLLRQNGSQLAGMRTGFQPAISCGRGLRQPMVRPRIRWRMCHHPRNRAGGLSIFHYSRLKLPVKHTHLTTCDESRRDRQRSDLRYVVEIGDF